MAYLCLNDICLLLTLSSVESLRCSSRAIFSASAISFTVLLHEILSSVAAMMCLSVAQRCQSIAKNCKIKVTPAINVIKECISTTDPVYDFKRLCLFSATNLCERLKTKRIDQILCILLTM